MKYASSLLLIRQPLSLAAFGIRQVRSSHKAPAKASPPGSDEELDHHRAARFAIDGPGVLRLGTIGFLRRPQDRCQSSTAFVDGRVQDLGLITILQEAEVYRAAFRDLYRNRPAALDRSVLHAVRVPLVEGAGDTIEVVLIACIVVVHVYLRPLDRCA